VLALGGAVVGRVAAAAQQQVGRLRATMVAATGSNGWVHSLWPGSLQIILGQLGSWARSLVRFPALGVSVGGGHMGGWCIG